MLVSSLSSELIHAYHRYLRSGGWAFSTTGAIEGAYQIKTKNLVSFSNQQLLSCDDADDGCSGG